MASKTQNLEVLYLLLSQDQIQKLNDKALEIQDHLRSRVLRQFLDSGFDQFCEEITDGGIKAIMERHGYAGQKLYGLIVSFPHAYIRKLEKKVETTGFAFTYLFQQYFQQNLDLFLKI
jgi:hypothetical protein